ncbi:hypothetical protein ONS95_012301 [Cadophora gregata]|uniref:uncharacterized protein n=1 Tax=Cadophora gregata TaxID=51156 RepID=UPI0026DADD1E|nr:uncharacterized protein ONS95_012301 [Cadophora gregata]KAK0117990.1 hypothetical protein ONS95_012301 [Cadophora gregata]KAK0123056.1 hypothetical protein ONS96_010065 [Cadophora gregata f. sp. sojae]
MGLLNLSIELLMTVLEHTVQLVGLTNAVRLRLVCKTFDREIPVAMCNTRLLESGHPRTVLFPSNSWLVQEHIFRETWGKRQRNNNLPAALFLAAETLTPKACKNPKSEQEQLIRKLCRAAVLNLHTLEVLSYLKPGAEQKEAKLRHHSSNNHVASAAAYLGDFNYFKDLIGQNQEIDSAESNYFGNPLRCAILQGHFDLVKFMLDHNVDVNYPALGKGLGSTALCVAASTGRQDCVELLLDPKYNCDTSTLILKYAILGAASAGHLEIVKILLRRSDEDPKPVSLNRILWEGCRCGQENIVQFALQLGADPNKKEEACGGLPLKAALRRNRADVTKTLLKNGAVLQDFDILYANRPGLSDNTVRVLYEFAEPEHLIREVKYLERSAQQEVENEEYWRRSVKLLEYHRRIVQESGGKLKWYFSFKNTNVAEIEGVTAGSV